jgi:alpha-mannosidase
MRPWFLLFLLLSLGCAAGSTTSAPPAVRKPLVFQAVRESEASPDPDVDLGACDVEIAAGDVLEYELYAADARAERAGVELRFDDGSVLDPPKLASSIAPAVAMPSSGGRERGPKLGDAQSTSGDGASWTRRRIALDAHTGRKIVHVELAARGVERGPCTFYVDDVAMHRSGGASVALVDAGRDGERRERARAGTRAACFAVDWAARYPSRYVPLGSQKIGEPWALLDLSPWRALQSQRDRSPSASASRDGDDASYADTIFLDAGVPFRFAAPGEERAFTAAGQRVVLTTVEGGRYYDLHVALAIDGDAPIDTGWQILGRGGASRRLAIRVPPRNSTPRAAPFVTLSVPVATAFEVIALCLPDDARVRVYAATARWRKDAPADPEFRRQWLSREVPGDDIERYLRDVEIGPLFAARAGFEELAREGANERQLFDLALRGDTARFGALLRGRLAAFDRASAAFKRDHVAFCVRARDGAHADWNAARESSARALQSALAAVRADSSLASSAPSMQACEWLSELDPDAFGELRRCASDGRIDVPAGSWTADPAAGASEAMARQLLLARSFARDRMRPNAAAAGSPPAAARNDVTAALVVGRTPADLSYARQLPQLCRSADVDLLAGGAPREAGDRPALFEWSGPDGSRVAAVTWRALGERDVRPAGLATLLASSERRGERVDWLVAIDADALAECSRTIALFADTDLAPSVSLATPSSWQKSVRRDVEAPFTSWDGTHESRNRRPAARAPACVRAAVRRAEAALVRAERYGAVASGDGLLYLSDEFTRSWKHLLWDQGFDGGDAPAARAVLADAQRVQSRAQELARDELAVLARAASTKGPGQPLVVFNPLPWDRVAPIEVAEGDATVLDPDLHAIPSQRTSSGTRVFLASLPSFGFAVFHLVAGSARDEAPRDRATPEGQPIVLANDALNVTIDRKSGRVSRMELAASGEPLIARDGIGGAAPVVIRAGDDASGAHVPQFAEAPDSVEVLERGPVRSVVRVERSLDRAPGPDHASGAGAKLAQDFVLYARSPELTIHTHVDGWRGPGRLVSVFQLAHASPWIVHGVPFGSAALPSAASDRWSEIHALDWIAQGDARASVALFDDADAAFAAGGKSLSIVLDDGAADVAGGATRELDCVVRAGTESWRAGAAHAAAELEHPPQVLRTESHDGARGARHSFLRLARLLADGHAIEGARSGLMLSALKPAEDGDDWVVRIYELKGDAASVRLTFDRPVFDARSADVLERPGASLRVDGAHVELSVGPDRIATIRVGVRPR